MPVDHQMYAPHPRHGIPPTDPEPLDAEPAPEDLAEYADLLRLQRIEDGQEIFSLYNG